MNSNTANANTHLQTVDAEAAADVLAESKVESSLDIGHSIIYVLKHPRKGALVLVNSALGSSAVITLTQVAEQAAGLIG